MFCSCRFINMPKLNEASSSPSKRPFYEQNKKNYGKKFINSIVCAIFIIEFTFVY